jgi:hypothetical protein
VNATDPRFVKELHAVGKALAKAKDIRAVIVTGAGRGFCSGIDLKAVAQDEIQLPWFREWEATLRLFETMYDKALICGIFDINGAGEEHGRVIESAGTTNAHGKRCSLSTYDAVAFEAGLGIQAIHPQKSAIVLKGRATARYSFVQRIDRAITVPVVLVELRGEHLEAGDTEIVQREMATFDLALRNTRFRRAEGRFFTDYAVSMHDGHGADQSQAECCFQYLGCTGLHVLISIKTVHQPSLPRSRGYKIMPVADFGKIAIN